MDATTVKAVDPRTQKHETGAVPVNDLELHLGADARTSLGEIGIVGAAAAVANAVYNAAGKRIRELPLTPDEILKAPVTSLKPIN